MRTLRKKRQEKHATRQLLVSMGVSDLYVIDEEIGELDAAIQARQGGVVEEGVPPV
jgi:transposase